MDSVFGVGSGSNANSPETTPRTRINEDFDSFLKLLTKQLQHQDPMDPLDATEFTNQLVQFASVEQQIAQSEKLDQLIDANKATQAQASLGFIGLDALAKSDQVAFDGDTPVTLGYQLEEPAATAAMRIFDETGTTVRVLQGPTPEGLHTLEWDGRNAAGVKVPAGTYRMEPIVTTDDDGTVRPNSFVKGTIDAIESDRGETTLRMGALAVSLDDIARMEQPVGSI